LKRLNISRRNLILVEVFIWFWKKVGYPNNRDGTPPYVPPPNAIMSCGISGLVRFYSQSVDLLFERIQDFPNETMHFGLMFHDSVERNAIYFFISNGQFS
jgi:hypothetical protein